MRYDDDGEFDDDDYCYYYCRDKWIDLERREKERVCVCACPPVLAVLLNNAACSLCSGGTYPIRPALLRTDLILARVQSGAVGVRIRLGTDGYLLDRPESNLRYLCPSGPVQSTPGERDLLYVPELTIFRCHRCLESLGNPDTGFRWDIMEPGLMMWRSSGEWTWKEGYGTVKRPPDMVSRLVVFVPDPTYSNERPVGWA